MFRFVHAADLHLGAAFVGVRAVDPEMASRLSAATYRALDNLVKLAVDESAAFVVLSGDLLNKADGNLRAWLALRDAAARLADCRIPSFIIRGNHDPTGAGEPQIIWPDACTRFSGKGGKPAPVTVDRETIATVFGISHPGKEVVENLALGYPKPDPGPFPVAILHTNCGSNADHAPYAPCSVQDLVGRGYAYWALGHIHKSGVLRASDPMIAYSGCTQGLNPKEQGPRGCLLVTVDDDGGASADFRETDDVRWHITDIEIGGMTALDDVVARAVAVLDGLRPDDGDRAAAVRLRLVGRGSVGRALRDRESSGAILDQIRAAAGDGANGVWVESLNVDTRADIDLGARRASEDFVGDFLREADAALTDESKLTRLRAALRPLLESDSSVRKLLGDLGGDPLSPGRLRSILDRAVTLGVDELVGAED